MLDRYRSRTAKAMVEFMGNQFMRQMDFIRRFKWSKATFNERMQAMVDAGIINALVDQAGEKLYSCNQVISLSLYPDSRYDARALAECLGGYTYTTKG